MDILVQSVLTQARRLRLSLHFRYLHRQPNPESGGVPEHEAPEARAIDPATSVVIIRRAYRYLEPIVRGMFKEATDVEVLLDRRWHDRRTEPASFPGPDRRMGPDRRAAAPMLDILIDVQP